MKTRDLKNNNNGHQGSTTADRGRNDAREFQKFKGVSNGGAQRSDQTSSRDGAHQPQRKQK
ncbi:hypothetical protein ACFQZX_09460 [Mucilaginibacter litoreus]|uniref:Stress-induced acidophilic repeat motif-containing protein n=1 Tax=Mucilaginibacter litoreus TaxID=1048221 RepID=A0ABW3ASL2_9SPHI